MTEIVKVLLVDDDIALCQSLAKLLGMEGFHVTAVHDAESGLHHALHEPYALVILDVMLPGGNGMDMLRRVRASSHVPIIMLTARGNEADRISGLELGADDYLPKPFSTRELLARMRSVLRRKAEVASPEVVCHGDIELRLQSRRVIKDGQTIELTGAEFDILLLLIRSAGRVFTREEIAESALGRSIGVLDRSIDNHISNLRKKLGTKLGDSERIRNVRGTGYAYTAEAGEAS